MLGPAGPARKILLLYAVLVAFYGAWAVVWTVAPASYDRLLGVYNVLPVHPRGAGPRSVPFFDLEGVISWSECARLGHNVYVDNPCDPYRRPANYSPLLVDLPLEVIGVRHAAAAGFVLDLAFLLLLPFVFRPRSYGEVAIAAAAACSHATFYAVERANIDVPIFIAIALAAMASQRSLRGRLWLYAVALGGALIKFYPVVLGALVLRERPRALAGIVAVFAVVLGVFVWHYAPELAIVTHQIPAFHYFSDMFGAGALPLTLQRIFALPDWTVRATKLVLVLALAGFAIKTSPGFARILGSGPTTVLLLCGTFIMVGCFLLQTNNSYREIFLMLTIPGLLRLGRRSDLARWALGAVVVLMWAEIVRHASGHWRPFVWSLYVVRELLWWFVAAVLAAIALAFVGRCYRSRRNDLHPVRQPVSMS